MSVAEWYEYITNDAVVRFESAHNFLCESGKVYMEVCVGYVDADDGDRVSVLPLFSNQVAVPGPVHVLGDYAFITINISPEACGNYGWDEESMCLWFDVSFEGKPTTFWVPPLSILSVFAPDCPTRPIVIGGGYSPNHFIIKDGDGVRRLDVHQAWLERDNGVVTGTSSTDTPQDASDKVVPFPRAKINNPKLN